MENELQKMDSEEYTIEVLKTLASDKNVIRGRLIKSSTIDLLHSAIGLSTEAAELLDMLKKHIFYGKDIDLVNLKEELGDIMWYFHVMMHTADFSMDSILKTNVAKLRARYTNSEFSEKRALERNLDAERQILEKKGEV